MPRTKERECYSCKEKTLCITAREDKEGILRPWCKNCIMAKTNESIKIYNENIKKINR